MSPRASAGNAFTRRPGLWLGLGAVLLTLASMGTGWWLGQRARGPSQPERPRLALEKEASQLRRQLADGSAGSAEQQRLLQVLLALQDNVEATQLLERMADQQPDRWTLRLMLAELRRDQNDRPGAEREVRQILNLRPNQVEALQLMALLQQEQGHGSQAEAMLKAAYKATGQPKPSTVSLQIGLILADLQLKLGRAGEADSLYQKLANDFPTDMRPVLARALLKQQQGQTAAALQLLEQARQRHPNQKDARLDQVATAWGLAGLRSSTSPAAPKAPSPQRNQANQPVAPPSP